MKDSSRDPKDSIYFKKFLELSSEAYNIVRKNGNFLITLLLLMVESGIPELKSIEKDIGFLQKSLILKNSNEQASQHFVDQSISALSNRRQIISDYCHLVRHKLIQ